jgi:hypothetical protein
MAKRIKKQPELTVTLNDSYNAPRTAGELADLLAKFPRDAQILMENFNEDAMFNGLCEVIAANTTVVEQQNEAHQNDDGPINTVVLGFWHEGRMSVVLGPKQQAATGAVTK